MNDEYEVQRTRSIFSERDPISYVVNLVRKICTYHVFQNQGFPCVHAINSIFTRRENPQEYTEDIFTIAAYTVTYSKSIYPLIIRSNLDETLEFEDSELGLI